jgi:hypothetical protein
MRVAYEMADKNEVEQPFWQTGSMVRGRFQDTNSDFHKLFTKDGTERRSS